MILKKIHVKNFRSIRDISVDVQNQLAIVGGNGSGKSSILRALERFFGQSTTIELDDFFGRKTDEPIEIGLTFTDFTDSERENFASRISNNEMSVVRVFEAGAGRSNGRYYGATLQHAPFVPIRSAENATAARAIYNQVRGSADIYATLPAVTRADQIPPALEAWEAAHEQHCVMLRDDGQFFGFTNVARGALNKSTSFVFIPAVRDASADALDSRGAVIARLMELVVRSAIQQRKDVQLFQQKVTKEYQELTDPEKLQELSGLSDELSETLQMFYRETAVNLQWRPPEAFSIPLPTADVFLDDDGFEGPVDRKGHGLQRAFILTLLQHLAKATSIDSARQADQQTDEIPAEEVAVEEAVEADEAVEELMPGLILAIEEPELYQHPTKQRHFAQVLSKLSNGELPGVARRTQILFATHSSLFVSTDRFDEIALARREKLAEFEHKSCRLTHSKLESIAQRLEHAYARPAGTFTADGLKVRLHIINSEIAEGFFADLVVLVEGVSDRAAILATADMMGVDFGSLGIAVLSADGKSKLDRPAAIFTSLEIPTYVIWDCDRQPDEVKGLVHNHALQRLLGSAEGDLFDAATRVNPTFGCFETKLETILKAEIGAELYVAQAEAVKGVYEITRTEDLEKAPFAMCELLKRCEAEGHRSQTLCQMVEAIVSLRQANKVQEA